MRTWYIKVHNIPVLPVAVWQNIAVSGWMSALFHDIFTQQHRPDANSFFTTNKKNAPTFLKGPIKILGTDVFDRQLKALEYFCIATINRT